MELGMRAGLGGVLVKKKSSGCLIVRKKGNDVVGAASGVGSSSTSRKLNAFNKRPFTHSGSSDSSLMPPSIRVCNGRKRDILEQFRGSGEGLIAGNDLDERELKRNKLDLFNSNEYDAMGVEKMRMRHFDNNNGVGFGGGRFMGSMHAARIGMDREFETGSNRYILDKMKNSYYERTSGLYPGDNVECSRFRMNRNGAPLPPPLLREKINSDEYIRIQGKNGVLKVMVNKKVGGGPSQQYDHCERVESKQKLRTEGFADKNVLIHPSLYLETKPGEKPGLPVRPEKKQIASKKSLSSKDVKGEEWDSDNSDTSLNPGIKNNEERKSEKKIISEDEQRNTEACKFEKRIISENEQTPMHEKLPASTIKEGRIRHGSATERQKLRERIREMLLNAGWTIDYRPRRNRDYLDAVYINPAGTAYWSIIKAYEAFQKQLNDDVDETKPKGNGSSFAPIADEVLSQLTRKTRKKMEKESKKNKKKKYDTEIESGKEPRIIRSARNKHDMNSMDTDSNGEKLSSFVKQGSNSMKNKMIENAIVSASSKSQNAIHHSNDGKEKSFFRSVPHHIHGRKSKNYGRCTLLVRSSNKGLNSESDGFVPYTGKRTVLSWLIDSGTVVLSQKVQYRRWKKVLLEGWITRDGVHCGCCSKILTVSKFELHAGSKLTQPYQNIYLESGVSLLQCLIDAWNRQENSEKIGFHSVDMDGDDPNDDACGICGDGGDLICCDSCPSTFHQSCLNIQMLPPGEWHCPNCTCKFCGKASGTFRKDDATMYALRTCNLCEKKYHDSCTKEMDALPNNLNTSGPSFCGKECKELLEHLKKFIGFKHELEAGFSWSLIHRTDEGSEATNRGIAHRVECNSKLAIALTVMDECFLPVTDRRSGINLIRNVLYNSGSNFSRLSYCGFYTAILERGDEIISVASLRFHGTKLAEMPFIGTRHIYRRQGMCRRLFSAIESALCCLKVEKLVIPLITELMHTWTAIFGFTHLEESLRQEMRSLNMLVFPGIDMLQKLLVEQEKHKGNTTAAGSKKTENLIKTKMANTVIDSSILQDPHGSDDASSNPANEMNQFSDASQEPNNQSLVDGSMRSKSHSEERLSDSVSDKCVSPSSTSHGALDMKDKIANAPPVDGKLNPSPSVSPNDNSGTSHPLDVPDCDEIPALVQETACSDPGSAENLDRKCHLFTAMNCDSSKLDINPVLDSQMADNTSSSKEVHMNDARGVLEAVASGNLSVENITKENNENVDVSDSVLNHADESLLQVRSDFNGEVAYEGERNLHSNTEVALNKMYFDESGLNASGVSSETDPD